MERGYKLNPHDRCVANRTINDNVCTIIWHVDDLKISHLSSEVVESEIAWLETIYGELTVNRGDQLTYLGMDFDFRIPGEVKLSMLNYLKEIIDDFPGELMASANTPANSNLFEDGNESPLLCEKEAKLFHHIVAKVLWASIRARPDLLTAISFLTSRVKSPTQDDYKKLVRMLTYLRDTIGLVLTLACDNTGIVKWWADAAYAVRSDMRSQSGATMSLGTGSAISQSKKQGLNTKSSTEAELVAADDSMSQLVWTRNFLLAQGEKVAENILFQDNKSAILLEKNGAASSSKRTRHINVRYFFISDRQANGELSVLYCETAKMVADYFTKPLQGKLFYFLRDIIMGIRSSTKPQECVEDK